MSGEIMEKIRMSVRAVVETTLHESDLAPSSAGARRMQEGAVAHRARQGSAMEKDYRKEVALSADYEGEALLLHVTGRADGIYTDADGMTVIEEIKLGAQGQPLLPAHRAQAAMYGHMLASQESIAQIRLRVLYVDVRAAEMAVYEEVKTAAQLHGEFNSLCAAAAAWEEKKLRRRTARNLSLASLSFPFDTYREGQRRLAANVYVALREKKRLFAQAPTGIGKTMAVLYPALRAIGEGKCQRAVFLAARTTGRRSAMDAMALLQGSGANAMTAEITAKDKICPQPVRDCRPDSCPLAKGFYDRLPAALTEGLAHHHLDRGTISRLAEKHRICPFELSLELAMLADVIVCDYNYIFDPLVAMDRLLQSPGGACLLVDEAHQLAPRVRDAYSAGISLDTLTQLRREAGIQLGRKNGLYRALTGAIRAMKEIAAREDFLTLSAPPEPLHKAMEHVREHAGEQLALGAGAIAADSFSLASGYLFAAGRFDARYTLLASGSHKHAKIELALLSAAQEILSVTRHARGTVYFSATLAPFDPIKKILGSEEGDACLHLPSPFDPAQLNARIEPIDMRYQSREKNAPQVAQTIHAHMQRYDGNTIVFFPSYAYMARIDEILLGMPDTPDFTCEKRGMTEEEKNSILAGFEDENRMILLAVLGGAFSEGIDLPGDRLKNVIIVSTGLPQPDEKIRAMQAYYDALGDDGFYLCMTLPGMIRVIQAAGRLIRTHHDTGTLLLIDSRYRYAGIRALLSGTLAGEALQSASACE
ncbi:MAG: ATP-dependent DNA helicase [Clostridia bacterium]|nr:ATP-dependent DNA helicase [Clostridia bacterium]